jgi:hypothetical protein
MAYNTGSFRSVLYMLQDYSITEVLLPFLLIFTVLFAILQKIKIFGEEKKNINVVLSMIVALLAVIPHVTRRYPYNFDPIVIINALIPGAAVLAITIILVLMLFGIWGYEMGSGVPVAAIVVILGVLGYIFGATVGWWTTPSSLLDWWNPELTALIIVILVFGIIVAFITGGEKKAPAESFIDKIFKRVR